MLQINLLESCFILNASKPFLSTLFVETDVDYKILTLQETLQNPKNY